MTLKQLEYFLAIAETGSITQAAEVLHVSQPPLSLQLKALEDELGVSLFERSRKGKGLAITPSGRLLEQRAQEIFQEIDQMMMEVRSKTPSLKTEIRVGAVNSVSNRLIPFWIRNYKQAHPHVDIHVSENSTIDILLSLNESKIDLGIVREPFHMGRYNYRLVFDPDMAPYGHDCFVTLADPSLYRNPEGGSIALTDMRELPLMMHRRYVPMFTKYCRAVGFMPNVICKNNDVMSLLSWARAGIGVAVLPYSSTLLNTDSRLVRKNIINPSISSKIYAVWSKSTKLSGDAEQFLELVTTNPSGAMDTEYRAKPPEYPSWHGKGYSFFTNTDCEYYPCHPISPDKEFNCLFCYCPLYALGDQCGGNFSYTETGHKDCSQCMIPHMRENYGRIIDHYSQIAEMMRRSKESREAEAAEPPAGTKR